MNREIKFRAWCLAQKKMFNEVAPTPSGNILVFGGWIKVGDMGAQRRDLYELNDAVLMQYTGLKDKNGKEIYEGDILKVRDPHNQFTTFSVIWRSGAWHVEAPRDTRFLKSVVPDANIIGNIYQNPKLLKK